MASGNAIRHLRSSSFLLYSTSTPSTTPMSTTTTRQLTRRRPTWSTKFLFLFIFSARDLARFGLSSFFQLLHRAGPQVRFQVMRMPKIGGAPERTSRRRTLYRGGGPQLAPSRTPRSSRLSDSDSGAHISAPVTHSSFSSSKQTTQM